MNILIVDDERLIVEDLERDVKVLYPDALIDTVCNAADALAYSDDKEYDIALVDIDLPDTDGLSLARKLIAAWPTINIIFVTGHSEFALEAHNLYCSAFLLKPVGIRKLKKAFDNLRRPVLDIPHGVFEEHYAGGNVIGGRIESMRELRGISRQELANLMEVSRQTVYRWEQGERVPDILTFVKLTRLLGMDINDILKP